MNWQQIHVTIPKDQLDAVEDALLELGALTVTYKDAGDNPVLEPLPGETPLWPELIVTGLFDADKNMQTVIDALQQQLPDTPIHHEQLEDQDWERSWMVDYHPMRFGDRLWVVPTNMDAPDPDAVNLRLDPGLAFGTGTHPTTSLCLNWLDQHDVHNKTVLDYGCGSGILAIAALLLGARSAAGVDIDPQALIATRDNAAINQVSLQIEVFLPEAFRPQQFDLVLANILSGPLAELAPQLASYTQLGGYVVLSGLLESQVEDIINAYQPWFDMQKPKVKDDWAMICGKKIK